MTRTLALSAATAGLTVAATSTAQADDDFAALHERWREMLVGADIDASHPAVATALETLDAEATTLLSTLETSPDRELLFPDLPIAGPDVNNIGVSFTRLKSLALAWATPGTTLHDQGEVVEALIGALRWLHDRGYNSSISVSGNWWFLEIGNPRSLLDLCTLLHDHLSTEDIEDYAATVRRFAPDPNFRGTSTSFAETGANRVDKALACAVRGALSQDADEIALARDAISDVVGDGQRSLFQLVTHGDGFYADGSFVQHEHLPYVGTYGNVALAGVARMFALLGGSPWEITDPDRHVILDAPEKSFAPFIWHGMMIDTVRGRAVSREAARDFHDGFSTVGTLLLMAESQPSPLRERYRSLALGWIDRSPESYLDHASIPEISRALTVLDAPEITPAPESVGHDQFPDQDRAVHRRPGWAFTVSVSSNRIGRYEWGNRENNLGWYQGDGMTYLYLDSDLTQFHDDFWPTVNPYRLPGTTIGTGPRESGEADGTGIPRATRPWAGGTSLLGRYGSIGMDHLTWDGKLAAKKSWFCVDEAVIALGSGITGTQGHSVETVVENRNLHETGDRQLIVDDHPAATVIDSLDPRPGARWAHLAGHGGYLFLHPGQLVTRRSREAGSWQTINSGGDTGGSPAQIERDYLSLVLEHGTDPHEESYAYVILPHASIARTKQLAADPGLRVRAQSPEAHVVEVALRRRRLTMANFFAKATTPTLTVSGSCSIVMSSTGREVEVAVSDPSRTQDSVTVIIDRVRTSRVLRADDGVRVAAHNPLTLDVSLAGTRGATRSITLAR